MAATVQKEVDIERLIAQEASDFIKELEVGVYHTEMETSPDANETLLLTARAGRTSAQIFQAQVSRAPAHDVICVHAQSACLCTARCSPYDILDLGINATENEIKKQYRRKSLLIHPDKFKHPRGIEVGLSL